MCRAGHCGPASHLSPARGMASAALCLWSDGIGKGAVRQAGEPPGGPSGFPVSAQLAMGRAKPLVALEGEWVPESSILYPCLWPRGRGKAAGMQESWPGPVPTGWGGRALQPASSLSSLCKQQRHTDSPRVRAHVCALAGGPPSLGDASPQATDGSLGCFTVQGRGSACRHLPGARVLTMYRSDPFISSFHPYTPTGTPLTRF